MIKKPYISVLREKSEKDWTLSEFHIDGIRRGYGVEDESRDKKVHGETCIPNGIYELGLRYSPRFSRHYYSDDRGYLSPNKDKRFSIEHSMIWVMGVPNFEYILWHWGNTDDDTHGCYIVGSDKATFGTQRGVSGSRVKYTEIYPVIYQQIVRNREAGLKTFIEYKSKILV